MELWVNEQQQRNIDVLPMKLVGLTSYKAAPPPRVPAGSFLSFRFIVADHVTSQLLVEDLRRASGDLADVGRECA